MHFCNNARRAMARAEVPAHGVAQGWAKALSRRAHHAGYAAVVVGAPSLSSGAHARDPVALPTQQSGCKAANRLFLAVRALAGRGLACRERIDRSGAALLEVLVGLRFLLFLVAAHLSLGHDDLPGARMKRCGAPGP